MKLLALIVSLPAVAYGGWIAYGFFMSTPYLAITNVEITGVERLSEADIAVRAGEVVGVNLLSLETGAVKEAVEAEPWVAEAKVKKSPLHTLRIDVRERKPLVLVKMDELYVMDLDGVVFKGLDENDSLDLPVVTGLEKRDENGGGLPEDKLLDLIAILRSREGFNLDHVSEIHVDAVYGLTIYTIENGVRLDVGFSRFEEKIRSFEKIVRARNGNLDGVEAMDITNPREVTVRFTNKMAREGGII